MVNRIAVAFTLSLLMMGLGHAERFVDCHDGDTCTLEDGLRVRFDGIDAPEIGQPFANEAREYLLRLVLNRDVILECSGWSYKRRVCSVQVVGLDVQKELVGWGLAYDSPKYSGGRYQTAEAFARKMHRGVWTLPNGGIRPWDYRAQRRQPKQKVMPD